MINDNRAASGLQLKTDSIVHRPFHSIMAHKVKTRNSRIKRNRHDSWPFLYLSQYTLDRVKMSFLQLIAVAVVTFYVITVDGGAQYQFYPQQNPFLNYYRPAAAVRPNYLMNQFNRRRPVLNSPMAAVSGYTVDDQAKIFFGLSTFFTT